MGADVHTILEVKYKGKWEYAGVCGIARNYTLFALMADVRSRDENIKPISKPRGFPSDACDYAKEILETEQSEYYSHSYLNSDEVKNLIPFLDFRDDLSWNLKDLFKYNFSLIEDFRILFAFDD